MRAIPLIISHGGLGKSLRYKGHFLGNLGIQTSRKARSAINLSPRILARSKYELTHYFIEIFVDQRIVKTLALTKHFTTSNWDSYFTIIDCSLTLITEIGMDGLNYCIIKISSDPKFKGLGSVPFKNL